MWEDRAVDKYVHQQVHHQDVGIFPDTLENKYKISDDTINLHKRIEKVCYHYAKPGASSDSVTNWGSPP